MGDETLQPAGTVVLLPPVAQWREAILQAASEAWIILLTPLFASTPTEEFKELAQFDDLLEKIVVFMPPMASETMRRLGVDPRARWNDWQKETVLQGLALPSYEERGLLFTPTRTLEISKSAKLVNDPSFWQQFPKLVPAPGISGEGLWNILFFGHAFEADDPKHVMGGGASRSGFSPGNRIEYHQEEMVVRTKKDKDISQLA
jgi:hypothetical protein